MSLIKGIVGSLNSGQLRMFGAAVLRKFFGFRVEFCVGSFNLRLGELELLRKGVELELGTYKHQNIKPATDLPWWKSQSNAVRVLEFPGFGILDGLLSSWNVVFESPLLNC